MLVSSVTQQVWLTKLFGWGLRAISGIIVILAVVYLVQVLPTLGQNTVIPIIQNMAIYFIIAVGVAWFSGHFFKIATEREQNLDERLLGYVLAGNLVNFEALAGWTRITQQDVANRLAKLSSSGMLRDYQIDLQNRMVTKIGVASSNYSNANSPQTKSFCPNCKAPIRPGAEYCNLCGTRLPSVAATPGTPSELDDAIKVKAKLYELEVLKQQGKISGGAYDKLKEEYEKKLAQADKGTQVY